MLPPPGFKDITLCGSGATSRVYRATEVETNKVVALKRMHRQLAESAEALSRLRRELRALSQLRHEGIVAVRDVIRWRGDPTVVMDYVGGCDLKELITDRGELPVEQIEQIARVLLDVLITTHAAGIVHRDIKPQNIRVDGGRVLLLDFGSARLDASSQLTATGTTVGTPDYMAPELFAGSVYDPRVDIYGLGATLFECCTGRAPQLADSLTALAFMRTQEDAPQVRSVRPEVPERLAQVIDRCLARNPEDRYAAASLALWALDHPDLERGFQGRRASNPPCLHCGKAIPPESTICSVCHAEHPFRYTKGSSHVVITATAEPQQLLEEVIGRFPEKANERDLRHLSERCAALEHGPQRLVSFIDQEEAERLTRELDHAGVQAKVVRDRGISSWLLTGLASVIGLLGLMFFVGQEKVLSVTPIVMGFVGTILIVERLTAAGRGQQGVLASAKASIAPGLQSVLWITTVGLFVAGASLPYISRTSFALRLQVPLLLGSGMLLLALLVMTFWARFTSPMPPLVGSPEPCLWDKVRRVFSTAPRTGHKRISRSVSLFLALLVWILVPLELVGVGLIQGRVPTAWRLWSDYHSDLSTESNEPIFDDLITLEQSSIDEVDIGLDVTTLDSDVDLILSPTLDPIPQSSVRSTWLHQVDPLHWGLSSGFALFAILLSGFLVRRRRRISKEADEIVAGLSLGDHQRRSPIDRAGDDYEEADALALLSAGDAFARGARRRGTELAHCLAPEDARRLRRVIVALTKEQQEERSLLARSILETDPEQALRFEFLELEGQLEAEAATRWAQQGLKEVC